MNLGLEGKVVLIVGASRGIGAAAARIFALEGSHLALLSRSRDDLERLAAEIQRSQPKTEIAVFERDATEPAAADDVVQGVVERFGRIDVLVNNAGAGMRRPFAELAEEEWSAALDLNLRAAIRFSRAAVSFMTKAGGGRIVNLGAVSAALPRRGQIASNVAKAGLVNFTRSLALELGPHKILVNVVCPGAVQGSRWETKPESARAALSRSVALERTGKPEEVAGLIAFLAGEQASFITGAVIHVDGGLSAGIGG